MPAIQILPKEDATNGWSRILSARQPAAALDGDWDQEFLSGDRA